MASRPPGWYDDGRGALRWWDGVQWTEHVQTPDAESAVPAPIAGDDEITVLTRDSSLPDELASDGNDPVSAPPGYPGGFPGGSTPSGAFISATEPRASKLWRPWAVVGMVLIGVVLVVTVLIPILIGFA